MKKINTTKLFALLSSALFISGCTTDFIEEKKNYQKVDVEIYQDEFLATNFVDNIYNMMLPSNNENMAMWSKAAEDNSDVAGQGSPSLFAKSTDEVAGRVDLNQEWVDISPLNTHCIKSIGQPVATNSQNNAYTRIRYCNLYLNNVDQYDGLDEDFKNQIKGQLYFWRAWQFFELFRLYGGIPIVTTEQGLTIDTPSNQTPRSSSEKTVNQIVADLEMAQSFLEIARPYTAADKGRITIEAAAALKGRVLLTWASPLFNRNDDPARWQRAYDANLEAYDLCKAAGKGLDPDWKNMWFKDHGMEAILSFGFNDFTTNTTGIAKNNYTEHQSRAVTQGGNEGIIPTTNIMDAFPMADGTPYDPTANLSHFYRNRDPRFYHTFAYNGSVWPYKENPNYKHWTYSWYPLTAEPGKPILGTNNPQSVSGVNLRKFTNATSSNSNNFRNNGTNYMEIRFAEVVLNLAESAVGINNLQEGKTYLQQLRERAGTEDLDGEYGLSNVNTRDEHFAVIINERTVEFAYENKRFHDLRRWLLYNDDFGTCTRLNQKPIEGSRRLGYYIIAKSDANTIYEMGFAKDPFKGASAPIINRDATSYPAGVNSYEDYVDYLYDNHFEVVVRDNIDPTDFTFKWYNEYYFFGIYDKLLATAPYLEQTQGWGGNFDPTK